MAKILPSLLLLPPPPSPIFPESVSAAYRPTIAAVFSILKASPTSTELTIVIPCPNGHLQGPRSQIYNDVQKLLGCLYSLMCVVGAKLDVDIESDRPGSVDARVVLLDYNTAREVSPDVDPLISQLVAGPIVDLPTFALTRYQWNLIFSVDGERGQKLFASYRNLANRRGCLTGHVHSVSGGVSLVQTGSMQIEHLSSLASPASHNIIAVGGTFDHLHAGHKLLLTATALLLQPTTLPSPMQRRLIVGITGDELLKNKKYAKYLQTWNQRQESVLGFLLSIISFQKGKQADAIETVVHDEPGPNGRAIHTNIRACLITIECVEIQDPFGPTITDETITALVVSGETRSGGQAVNDRRSEKGWNSLEVFEVDVLDSREIEEGSAKAEDFAAKISSTAIRQRKAEEERRVTT